MQELRGAQGSLRGGEEVTGVDACGGLGGPIFKWEHRLSIITAEAVASARKDFDRPLKAELSESDPDEAHDRKSRFPLYKTCALCPSGWSGGEYGTMPKG